MATYSTKDSDIERNWYLIDAANKKLGRLASQVASILMGKHKPYYVPYLDTGDHVVVINARKLAFTEKRLRQKVYYRHSGYPGGIKAVTAGQLIVKNPERMITLAVKGMLPKNRLGRKMLKKLKVYAEGDHPHESQNPQSFT